MKFAPFYFLRHGETDWNRRRIMQGHTDIALNVQGVRQAQEVAQVIARVPIATICCSSLERAQRTAEIVRGARDIPVVPLDDLKECRFGVYEGQPSNGAWREAWECGGSIPGGETFEEYVQRAWRGIQHALSYPAPVLVVAHGGTFWAIDRFALNRTGTRVPNCTLFRLDPPRAGEGHWTCSEIAAPATTAIAIGEAAAG